VLTEKIIQPVVNSRVKRHHLDLHPAPPDPSKCAGSWHRWQQIEFSNREQRVETQRAALCLNNFALAARRDFPEFAVCLIRHDVECPVSSLSHVAYALPTLRQQMLFSDYAVFLDNQPHESL
jgi:hypothetical protein